MSLFTRVILTVLLVVNAAISIVCFFTDDTHTMVFTGIVAVLNMLALQDK